MIEAQKQSIANRAVQLRREGRDEMRLNFSDPMAPFKRVFDMLLSTGTRCSASARRPRGAGGPSDDDAAAHRAQIMARLTRPPGGVVLVA